MNVNTSTASEIKLFNVNIFSFKKFQAVSQIQDSGIGADNGWKKFSLQVELVLRLYLGDILVYLMPKQPYNESKLHCI